MGLTTKNKKFCEEYIANNYNATHAYIKAYYAEDFDYNQRQVNIAESCGSRLLRKQEVKDYIQQLQHERFEALSINADRIATELSTIAFGNIGVECTENGKLKALELLGKQLQLYTQKIEATVDETIITVSVEEDED